MKKIIFGWLLSAGLITLFPAFANAQSATISYESFTINAGEEKEMAIDLTNPTDVITLVQFDLRLPSGLSLKKAGNEYDFDMAGRTNWRYHSLVLNVLDNGSIRFLLSSTSNTVISDTKGAIIKMTLVADDSYAGGIVTLENILMVTPDEKEIKQGTYPDVAKTPLFSKEDPFNIKAGQEKELVIDLQNPNGEITLVQFDLRLPNGLSLKKDGNGYVFDMAGRTTWRYHSLVLTPLADGSIRVLLSSTNKTVINDKQGDEQLALMKVTLVADGDFSGGQIALTNILLVTPQEKEIRPDDVIIRTETPFASFITVEDFTISNGGEAKMTIGLNNPKDQIALTQYDLRLPTGLTLKNFGITGSRTNSMKHKVEANSIGDIVRFLLLSSNLEVLNGTQGAIIEMTFYVASNFREGSIISLEDILLVTPEEKEIMPANVQFAAVRKAGDVNFDGTIDVADIASIITVMAGGNSSSLIRADVNNDGTTDVADIATVISYMAQKTRQVGLNFDEE